MEAMNNVKIAIILGNNLFKIWFINIVNYVKLVIHKMIALNVLDLKIDIIHQANAFALMDIMMILLILNSVNFVITPGK